MDFALIQKLIYSCSGNNGMHHIHQTLKDTLHVISAFFKNNINNKLCIVFPSKEYAAQWLSVPMVLFLIQDDYEQYKSEIIESYKIFIPGDKLILNNKAIVEWVGIKIFGDLAFSGPTFKTKGTGQSSGVEVTIGFDDAIKLQNINASRVLSSLKTVKEVLPERNITSIERLLKIDTFGNKKFIKNSICLISKFKSYDDSIVNVFMNHAGINDYFKLGKIDENGQVSENSPFLISNNFSNLILCLYESKPVSKIIIDGFNAVTPRSDFSDIDKDFKIPTILITDLSEIDSFEEIKNQGFDFYNFTKENITIKESSNGSPFESFERKLNKYILFRFERVVCNNAELESISLNLHALPKEDSDENLNILKISLIQHLNLVSRICYFPTETEISKLIQKVSSIESHFLKCCLWLGEAKQPIERSISLLKIFVQQLSDIKTEKCVRLEKLIQQDYDYIICPTEEEANTLSDHIAGTITKVISVADVNNNLLSEKHVKAILTGWPKSGNLNRILSLFLFSELTVLFYQFENRYYNSLQKRNRKNNKYIKPTITKDGYQSASEESISQGFEHLYPVDEVAEITSETSFDIVEFELKIDDAQYSKYFAKGNMAESCKAKRISFENNTFIYATESHKFMVINELINMDIPNPNIHSEKYESLHAGDVIAFINTDTDVLVALIELSTKSEELVGVKEWTNLWKELLRAYYVSSGYDFKKLIVDLRKYNCKRHEATIRTWLQDDNRIGPDDDDDLKSIALMTKSNKLLTNITTVRKAISQMTSWRMKASDKVREIIKNKLVGITKHTIINSRLEIQGLGSVDILKVIELNNKSEQIDKRFVNRLLQKEFL